MAPFFLFSLFTRPSRGGEVVKGLMGDERSPWPMGMPTIGQGDASRRILRVLRSLAPLGAMRAGADLRTRRLRSGL